MIEYQMSSEEIKKSLEVCAKPNSCYYGKGDCPLKYKVDCHIVLARCSLKLINQLQEKEKEQKEKIRALEDKIEDLRVRNRILKAYKEKYAALTTEKKDDSCSN